MTMIEPEVMAQIRALSEENAKLREEMLRMSHRLDTNHANLIKHVELELTMIRDAATRAVNMVKTFEGRINDFTDQQRHFKTDFDWWAQHFDRLSRAVETLTATLKETSARLEKDNQSFKEWAVEKISQIGRIYRR